MRSSYAGPILIGSTATSEARVLLGYATDEFAMLARDTVEWGSYNVTVDTTINGKDTAIVREVKVRKALGDAIKEDSLFISLCQLRINGDANVYRFGDTTDNAISFSIYELQKNFSAFATWDSVYDAAGSSTHYSPFSVPLGQYVNSTLMPALDETIGDPNGAFRPDVYTYNESGIPLVRTRLGNEFIKRLFRLGLDSAGREKMYGLALHPTGMRSIARFDGTVTLQVNFRRLGTNNLPFIRKFTLTPFNLLQTPPAAIDEAVIQGGRKHTACIRINLDSLPSTAIIFDGELALPIDNNRSEFGTGIQDQGVVMFSPLENADTVVFAARITSDRSKIVISNLGQRFRIVNGQSVSVGLVTMGKFLQEYVHKPGVRHPMYISSQTNTRLDRIVLKKSTEAPGSRPFLRVFYSLQSATP